MCAVDFCRGEAYNLFPEFKEIDLFISKRIRFRGPSFFILSSRENSYDVGSV